jgi:hypothetical protein
MVSVGRDGRPADCVTGEIIVVQRKEINMFVLKKSNFFVTPIYSDI